MRHERYMTHLRWHSGKRPFACAMCEKSFRDRSELNRHSRRHTGDLPYKWAAYCKAILDLGSLSSILCRCNTCGKGFLRKERYITHMRIHTGEKPFVCGVCTRGYRDKRELKNIFIKNVTSYYHKTDNCIRISMLLGYNDLILAAEL